MSDWRPAWHSEDLTIPDNETSPSKAQRAFLCRLQQQALGYFLDNQAPNGLVLDRQRNHGRRQPHGWCSTAASGMGLVALALAAASPYRLLTRAAAAGRIRTALETALHALPHDHGIMPHFIDSRTGAVAGADVLSTVDSSWLVAGALWAAAYLEDAALVVLADRLYGRIDWHYWTAPDAAGARGLLRHGKGRDRRFLATSWDRLNGETLAMYVLGAGAVRGLALSAQSWAALRPFYGTVAGLRFNNADLGLFAFEYGLDLVDTRHWMVPGGVDLFAEARLATVANRQTCRQAATSFATYRCFWGLSDGDGPGEPPQRDAYRAYGPGGLIDGTAHLTATLAAVPHDPGAVWENLQQAAHDRQLGARGRYGFSNVNVDRHWVGRDMVGIDAGAAVLALDNYLAGDRVRAVFQALPCVVRGMRRLGFTRTARADTPRTGRALTVRGDP